MQTAVRQLADFVRAQSPMATELFRATRNLAKRFMPHALWQVQVYALICQPLLTSVAEQLADQNARVNDETHAATMSRHSSRWCEN